MVSMLCLSVIFFSLFYGAFFFIFFISLDLVNLPLLCNVQLLFR